MGGSASAEMSLHDDPFACHGHDRKVNVCKQDRPRQRWMLPENGRWQRREALCTPQSMRSCASCASTQWKGCVMEWMKPGVLLGSIVYALAGVLIFWISFVVIDKLTPYNLWEEIVEKQNKALAMVVAAMSLGICIIIAAAIH
jgi:hypothetical protein